MSYIEKKEYLWQAKSGAKPIDNLTKEEAIQAVKDLIIECERLRKNQKATPYEGQIRRMQQMQGGIF